MAPKERKTMTIANKIAEIINKEITYGKIPAGEEITEQDIEERFHVSNIPVREALRILEGEGYIIHRKFSGYNVRKINPEEMLECYDIMRFLTTQILSQSIPCYTELTYHHFRIIIDGMDNSNVIDNTVSLFKKFVEEAFTSAGLKYSMELAMQIMNHNTPIIKGMVEKIYKGKFPTAFLRQFMQLCQQKETKKGIKIWMDEYEQRTKNYVSILSIITSDIM
jgi:DNA-binding GntR family transcriptional regulator